MKKLIVIILIAFSFLQSFSQSAGNDTTQYIYYRFTYGNALDRYWAKKVFLLPKDTIYSKDGLALKNGILYRGNGISWATVGSGGPGGAQTLSQVTALGNGTPHSVRIVDISDSTIEYGSFRYNGDNQGELDLENGVGALTEYHIDSIVRRGNALRFPIGPGTFALTNGVPSTLYRFSDSICTDLNGIRHCVLDSAGGSSGTDSSITVSGGLKKTIVGSNINLNTDSLVKLKDSGVTYVTPKALAAKQDTGAITTISAANVGTGIPISFIRNDSLLFKTLINTYGLNWSTNPLDSTLIVTIDTLKIPSMLNRNKLKDSLAALINAKVGNAGNSKSIQTGVYSARPAASNCLCYYVATDSTKIYYDNGSWITIGGGGSQTLPQVLATGRTFSANDSVLLALDTLKFKNGVVAIDSANSGREIIGGSMPSQIGNLFSDLFKNRTTIGAEYTTVIPNVTLMQDSLKLHVTGGDAGTYANYIQRNYYTGNETWTLTWRGRINAVNSTSLGLVMGLQGTNFSFYAQFVMDNASGNLGKIQLQTVLGTTFQTSTPAATVSAGDSVVLFLVRNHGTMIATYQDITSSTSSTMTYNFPYGAGGNYYPNASLPRIYLQGTGLDLNFNEWTFQNNNPKNTPVLLVSHSIGQGYGSGTTTPNGRYMNVLFNNDYSKFAVDAGSSDNMTDKLNEMPEIINYSPSYTIVDIGTNDIAAVGLTVQQFTTKYMQLVRKLLDANCKIILLSVTPRNTVDVTPYNTAIQKIASLYGLKYVDNFTSLASGTNLNAAYDYGDHVHINAAGHAIVAANILAAAPEVLTAGRDYNVVINNKRTTINNPIQFADMASFNGNAYQNIDFNIADSSAKIPSTRWVKQVLGSGSNTAYIYNQTTQQTGANFNIDGIGKVGSLQAAGSYIASGALAKPNFFNPTLVAAANNDVLVGFDINPTFTPGAFSPVTQIGFRVSNGYANIPSNNLIVGATGDPNTARIGVTGGTLQGIKVNGGTGTGIEVQGTINSSGTLNSAIQLDPTLTAQANGVTQYGLWINPTFNDNGKTGIVDIGLKVANGLTLLANGLQFDINGSDARIVSTNATTIDYQVNNTTLEHNFKSFSATANILQISGSTSGTGNSFSVLNTSAAPSFTVKGAGNVLAGTSTDNSTGQFQSLSASQAQLALHYDATHFGKFTIGSASNLDISGITGLTLPFGALPNQSGADSIVTTTTTSGIATLGRKALASILYSPFPDNVPIIKNNSDNTKLLKFDLSGFPTATTYSLTPQSGNYTIAGINLSQTFGNTQTFTNSPIMPTASPLDNSTKGATTAYTDAAIVAANPTKFTETADNTITNTASNLTMVGSGTGSITLGANTVTVGKTIRIKGFAYLSTAAVAPSLVFTFANSSSSSAATAPTLSALLNNTPLEWEMIMVCRTAGASGAVSLQGWISINGTKTYIGSTSTFLFDTTISQTIDLQAQFGTANSSNTIVTKTHQLRVE